MTQYTDKVERARLEQDAEAWAQGVAYIHANNGIIETKYNSGDIEYLDTSTNKVTWHREKAAKQTIINNFQRALSDLLSRTEFRS